MFSSKGHFQKNAHIILRFAKLITKRLNYEEDLFYRDGLVNNDA